MPDELYRVRPAVPDDLVGMARVHVATWKSTYRGMVPDGPLDALTVESDIASGFGRWLKAPLPETAHFVAVTAGGEVVGYAVGGPPREPEADFTGELGAIYVRQDHQRHGVGSALVGAVAGHLVRLDRTSMIVWVIAANPYQRFYQRLGGIPVRARVAQSRLFQVPLHELSYGWKDVRPLARP